MGNKPQLELQKLVQVLELHQTGLLIASQVGRSLRPLVIMQFFVTALQLSRLPVGRSLPLARLRLLHLLYELIAHRIIHLFALRREYETGQRWLCHCTLRQRLGSVCSGHQAYTHPYGYAGAASLPALKGYFFEPNCATFSAVRIPNLFNMLIFPLRIHRFLSLSLSICLSVLQVVRSAISYMMMLRTFIATGQQWCVYPLRMLSKSGPSSSSLLRIGKSSWPVCLPVCPPSSQSHRSSSSLLVRIFIFYPIAFPLTLSLCPSFAFVTVCSL